MRFDDLPPASDPKGGSPKTPAGGIPVRQYRPLRTTHTVYDPHNGHGIWKMATNILAGLNIGLVAAYFTAIHNQGVQRYEMEAYVRDYSPYIMDKQTLADHNRAQDESIGSLRGKQERVIERLSVIEGNEKLDAQDRNAMHTKLDIVAKMLEDQHPKK